ncbi:FecR family protein [Muricauda oceani]|uniref:FecR family protein n=1 Tax=Flagellimonas oceani TaxID=2698672 RepID=A0A6G7J0E5_9FLAO|nr:FecR family protein [Allomuricauda oceani]MBW8243668.1 FecR family protein [Allomuricauda oceani]QII43967.1 FecR family protein [Allomuricauda oceani]
MEKKIIKYLTDEIDQAESEEILKWLEKPGNAKKFQALVKEDFEFNYSLTAIDEEAALEQVKRKLRENKKTTFQMYWPYAAVAASILVLIAISFVFFDSKTDGMEPTVVKNNIRIGTDKATLTLGNGMQVALGNGATYISDNVASDGARIVYRPQVGTGSEMGFNYLTIPRGGKYHLVLSDQSEVWLNSETKIKYPVNFIPGTERKVELVYGEAYFKVSKSAGNQSSAFKVLNAGQEVEVLGTIFNIEAYRNENEINTTLVEGTIALAVQESRELLSPKEQLRYFRDSGSYAVQEVNVDKEIAWINGEFSFDDDSLEEVMRVLSRWYDVEIKIASDSKTKQQRFKGRLSRNQAIEKILTSLKKTNNVDYQINDHQIFIN